MTLKKQFCCFLPQDPAVNMRRCLPSSVVHYCIAFGLLSSWSNSQFYETRTVGSCRLIRWQDKVVELGVAVRVTVDVFPTFGYRGTPSPTCLKSSYDKLISGMHQTIEMLTLLRCPQ